MPKVVWLFVVEAGDWQQLLAHLLKFVGRPPVEWLVVAGHVPDFRVLHQGPATFDALKALKPKLELVGPMQPGWQLFLTETLCKIGSPHPIDVYHCHVGHSLPEYHPPLLGGLYSFVACYDHFGASSLASKSFGLTMAIGELHMQVDGYSLASTTRPPKSALFWNGEQVREHGPPGAPRSKPAFAYGATPVPLTSVLRHSLDLGKPLRISRLDVLGFIEEPPVFMRSCPVLVRSSGDGEPKDALKFRAIIGAMVDANKVGLARLQTGTQVQMVVLVPLPGGNESPRQLLMETLPFAEDVLPAIAQFPTLGEQPRGPYDDLLDELDKVYELPSEQDALGAAIYSEMLGYLDQ